MNCKKRMFCRVAAEPDSVLYTEYGYSGRSWHHIIYRFVYKYPPAFHSKDYAPAGEENPTPPTEDERRIFWLKTFFFFGIQAASSDLKKSTRFQPLPVCAHTRQSIFKIKIWLLLKSNTLTRLTDILIRDTPWVSNFKKRIFQNYNIRTFFFRRVSYRAHFSACLGQVCPCDL